MEAITLKALCSIEHGIPVKSDANDILVAAKAFRAEHCQVADVTVIHVRVQVCDLVSIIELRLNSGNQALVAKVIRE